jgi:hypothetical protein
MIVMLSCCIAKCVCISEAPDTTGGGQAPVTAAEVCLYGLNIVMPLMTLELLKFPSLCLQYFRTVTLVCEIYPDKERCAVSMLILKSLNDEPFANPKEPFSTEGSGLSLSSSCILPPESRILKHEFSRVE